MTQLNTEVICMPKTVETKLDLWKNRLIDRSKRNNMINFRPTKPTIHVIDELPTEIFKKVIKYHEHLDFLDFDSWENPKEYSWKAEIPSTEYVGHDDSDLADRYIDNFLQTQLEQEELNKKLYLIYLKSRSSMEEQGYNTLFLALGFLEYYESDNSHEKMRAPILLLPVELKRNSVQPFFQLYPLEDEFLLNPAIILKLEQDFGIKIDDLQDDQETVSADDVLDNFKNAISGMNRWKVLNDIYLGIFSFNKYIMYNDLHSQGKLILKHPVVAALLAGDSEKISLEASTLPDPATLDDQLKPQEVFQVLDADSSQQVAILAAKNGQNFVLQGPPGTGKSQTITNIISECVTCGKTVLFVSEKMAALEVVKKRLEEVGLGDFCIELHSAKTNKREVTRELGRCLRLQRANEPERIEDLNRLEQIRKDLNEYVRVLHTPIGKLQISPFYAHGQIASYERAPEIFSPIDKPMEYSREDLEDKKRHLRELSVNMNKIGQQNQHTWYGCQITNWDYKIQTEVHKYLLNAKESLLEVEKIAKLLANLCDTSAPGSLEETENLIKLVTLLLKSPQPETFMLQGEDWICLSDGVRQAVNIGTKFSERRELLSEHYTEKLYDLDLEGILRRKEKYDSSVSKLFKPDLWPQFWNDSSALKKVSVGEPTEDLTEVIADLRHAIAVQASWRWLDTNDDKCRKLFGKFWNGRDTDWEKITEVVSWVDEFVKTSRIYGSNGGIIKLASDPEINGAEDITESCKYLEIKLNQLRDNWKSLKTTLDFDESVLKEGCFEASSFLSLCEKINSWIEDYESLADWVDFRSSNLECEENGLAEFLRSAFDKSEKPEDIIPAFLKGFYKQWLDEAYSQNHILKKFRGEIHDESIEKFQALDKFQLKLARARARYILSNKLPDAGRTPSSSSELGLLWHEIGKKRRHMPLRKLIPKMPDVLKAIKPCFMMSPLSVAQYLPPGSIKFDVIIFDEASQICPEDAIGAISRGKQLVVAGDDEQLPPTTFFQVNDIDYNEEDEDLAPLESILRECYRINMHNIMLLWHYRSKNESLIAFSNRHIYNNNLNTFPGPYYGGKESGVSFEYVESGVYDRGKSRKNKKEALYVAEKIIEHVKKFPNLSLGVVAFSQPQQEAILLEIERLRRENPRLEFFFGENKSEHFFVKNLETVQGDERDVIYLCVGYGKNEDGQMTMNFGPLNQEGGYRRLNVAITRAKEKVVVFSSIHPDDMDISKTESRGVKLLKYYLDFAIKGVESFREEIESHPEMDFDSPFEKEVYDALTEKGLQLRNQVGCSRYRIDLAVVDEEKQGRFILGIECDGAMYHSPKTARDRDRLRQEVLERLGWRIHRVWSTDWIRNPKREVERILNTVANAKEEMRPVELEQSKSEDEESKSEDFYSNSRDSIDTNRTTQEYPEPMKSISDLPEGVVPYSKTPVIHMGRPEQLYGADIQEVEEVVLKIVNHEGPIHIQETARRVAEFWGMRRVGKRVIGIVKNAVSGSESVKRKDDFLWPAEMKSPPLRRCNKDDFFRPIDYVCVEEIARAAFLVVKKDFYVSREELIKQVAKHLGYDRVGDNIQTRVEEGIEFLLRFKRIAHDDECIRYLQS